jgi:branched-chain amino acid transport system ATP-binding protein
MTTILSCSGVSKAFGGVQALSDVAVEVAAGETLGIIGPNGSGKTTLFNILSGHERPDAGRVRLGGRDATGLPPHRVAAMGLARTFQNLRLFAGMTAVENVMAGGHLRAPAGLAAQLLHPLATARHERQARQEALDLLDQVGLSGHGDSLATALSYGQTKRVELARALNVRPKVLLLDEPTAGMNDAQATEILELVRSLQRRLGLTLVIIEHNVPVLVRFAERFIALDAGRVLISGTPEAVMRDPAVIDAYLGSEAV